MFSKMIICNIILLFPSAVNQPVTIIHPQTNIQCSLKQQAGLPFCKSVVKANNAQCLSNLNCFNQIGKQTMELSN